MIKQETFIDATKCSKVDFIYFLKKNDWRRYR
jgi:hypothetical protein